MYSIYVAACSKSAVYYSRYIVVAAPLIYRLGILEYIGRTGGAFDVLLNLGYKPLLLLNWSLNLGIIYIYMRGKNYTLYFIYIYIYRWIQTV